MYFFLENSGDISDTSEPRDIARTEEKTTISEKTLTLPLSSPLCKTLDKNYGLKKTREFYGPYEHCYVMDAKSTGNIGRYLNVIEILSFCQR